MTAIALALVLAPAAAILSVAGLVARTCPPLPRLGQPSPGWMPVRALHRIGAVGWIARLGRGERIGDRLEAAGSGRAVEEVLGLKCVLAGGVLGLTLAVAPASPASVVLATAAFMVPDLVLARAARARLARAQRELPLLLDVVAAAVQSGLTGQLAMRRAAVAIDGPLADELRAAFHRVDLGGRWGDQLDAVAERLALPDLRRAVAVLLRGDVMGSPLAEGLAELARESREARRAAMTERARKAPVKMLFPLVFLILPAFLLLTVVPVLVTTLGSIR